MLPTLAGASKRRLDWQAQGGSPCGHRAHSSRSLSSPSCSGGGSANKALAQSWTVAEDWRRTFPAPLSPSGTHDRVVATAIGLSGQSGEPHLYAVGPITIATGDVRFKIVRYNQSGTLVNELIWPPPSQDRGLRIPHAMTIVQGAVPGDGGSHVFITGEVPGAGGSRDMMTISVSEDLSTVYWSERYNYEPTDGFTGDDIGVAISADMNGVAVVGASMGDVTGVDFVTIVYGFASGTPVMSARRLHIQGDDVPSDVRIASESPSSGAVVFATGSTQWGSTKNYATVGYQISTGNVLSGWPQTYDNSGQADTATALAIAIPGESPNALEGAVYVTGGSASATDSEMLTLKYRMTGGAPRWTHSYTGAGNGTDMGTACTTFFNFFSAPPGQFDGAFLYVTGYARNEFGHDDFATFQFRDIGDSYDRHWQAITDGVGNGNDRAVAAAAARVKHTNVPRQPHAFVTGLSQNAAGMWEFRTLMFTAEVPSPSTSKVPDWHIESGAVSGTTHIPSSISVSPRDEEREQNVYVGGGTASSSGDGFFIIKYFETFIP